jgi:thiazole tautomerase (transcriptional regulator TenI)
VTLPFAGVALAVPAVRPLPVLHAVTTDTIIADPDFFAKARAVMAAGRGRVAVHLRSSGIPTRSAFIAAEFLAELQRSTTAWLIVNDRIDVALAAEARGVQLPAGSFAMADARRLAPGIKFGRSVHSAFEAESAARDGIDWMVAGHLFQTPSHEGVAPRGLAFVRDVVRSAGAVPVIGIGGIAVDRVASVRQAGCAGVATIRGIWSAAEPGDAVAAMLTAWDSACV